jgi:hypothetical protein
VLPDIAEGNSMADQNSTACLCPNGHLRTDQAGRCGNVSLFQLWLRGNLWMDVAALAIASILNVLLLTHLRMTRFA